MCTDFNLVRAHFESALGTLAQLNDFTSEQDQIRLLELAALAHGAGARRLRRIEPTPWLGEELLELHRLEERVQRAIAHAERENLPGPDFVSPAAQ